LPAAKKLVILAAVNGGAQQDRDGAKVPITPAEIAEAAHECYKSGASVVHIHAGYAPLYSDQALDAPLMNSISKALQRLLRQHEPFPAIVMDRHWNVLMTNDAAPQLFNCFIDLAKWPKPRNLLHLMFDPAGLRLFVANWPETARGLLGRVYREALGRVIDERTKALLAQLSQYPGVKPEWRVPPPGATMPMIPLTFVKEGVRLNYFSMITTVGTPKTVTAEELRLECMFPADDATEAEHSRFVLTNSGVRTSRH